jgi:ribonuclease-3
MLTEVSPELSNKDFKTQLQEYVQSRKISMPEYEIIHTEGKNHNQTFYVSCTITSIEKQTEGKGLSRRRAEQIAAELLLKEIKSE